MKKRGGLNGWLDRWYPVVVVVLVTFIVLAWLWPLIRMLARAST